MSEHRVYFRFPTKHRHKLNPMRYSSDMSFSGYKSGKWTEGEALTKLSGWVTKLSQFEIKTKLYYQINSSSSLTSRSPSACQRWWQPQCTSWWSCWFRSYRCHSPLISRCRCHDPVVSFLYAPHLRWRTRAEGSRTSLVLRKTRNGQVEFFVHGWFVS